MMKSFSNGAYVFWASPYKHRASRCLLGNFQYYNRQTGFGTFNVIDPGYCLDRIEPVDVIRPLLAQALYNDRLFAGG